MNYNNGQILDINTIKNKEKAFHDFAEGSIILEKLLKLLYQNQIETIACCRGHSKEQEAYIKFKVEPQTLPFFQILLNLISNINDYEFNIQNTNQIITADIRIPAILADKTFQSICKMLTNIYPQKPELENSWMNKAYQLSKIALENSFYIETIFKPQLQNKNICETLIFQNEDPYDLKTIDVNTIFNHNQTIEFARYYCSNEDLTLLYHKLNALYTKTKRR